MKQVRTLPSPHPSMFSCMIPSLPSCLSHAHHCSELIHRWREVPEPLLPCFSWASQGAGYCPQCSLPVWEQAPEWKPAATTELDSVLSLTGVEQEQEQLWSSPIPGASRDSSSSGQWRGKIGGEWRGGASEHEEEEAGCQEQGRFLLDSETLKSPYLLLPQCSQLITMLLGSWEAGAATPAALVTAPALPFTKSWIHLPPKVI